MRDQMDQRKRILLIDDSPIVADVVREALEPFGYRVIWIADGAAVPAALAQGLPALIILDVMMPRVDGYKVCRRLRAEPTTADLPILMLTARAEGVDRVVELEPGADDYLTKPFGERELLVPAALLRRARSLGRGRSDRRASTHQPGSPSRADRGIARRHRTRAADGSGSGLGTRPCGVRGTGRQLLRTHRAARHRADGRDVGASGCAPIRLHRLRGGSNTCSRRLQG